MSCADPDDVEARSLLAFCVAIGAHTLADDHGDRSRAKVLAHATDVLRRGHHRVDRPRAPTVATHKDHQPQTMATAVDRARSAREAAQFLVPAPAAVEEDTDRCRARLLRPDAVRPDRRRIRSNGPHDAVCPHVCQSIVIVLDRLRASETAVSN